jgi:FkbM family methyltransferase
LNTYYNKASSRLRGYAHRYPTIGRFTWRSMRLLWWIATFQAHRRIPDAYVAWKHNLPVAVAKQGERVIYVNPQDERGRQMIEQNGSLNPPTLSMWQRLLARTNWTDVIDIGANYGEMLVGLHLPPSVKITAVEPNPKIAFYLERTLREAGQKVRIVRKAISEKTGTATLLLDRQWSGTTRFASLQRGEPSDRYEPISVPTVTFDHLLDSKEPDRVRAAIKIDIEGYELPVLKSALATLNRLDHFEILMEILFVTQDDLDWIFENFSVQVYDLATYAFVNVQKPIVEEMIISPTSHPTYYRNDMILGRKV